MLFDTFSSGIAILRKRLRETRAGSSSLCNENLYKLSQFIPRFSFAIQTYSVTTLPIFKNYYCSFQNKHHWKVYKVCQFTQPSLPSKCIYINGSENLSPNHHQVTEVQYVNIKPPVCETHGSKVSRYVLIFTLCLDSVHLLLVNKQQLINAFCQLFVH